MVGLPLAVRRDGVQLPKLRQIDSSVLPHQLWKRGRRDGDCAGGGGAEALGSVWPPINENAYREPTKPPGAQPKVPQPAYPAAKSSP
jgi:hypothetical protein